MLIYSLQGKDGPWKSSLLGAFGKWGKKASLSDVDARARRNFKVLAEAVKVLNGANLDDWNRLCNLRVAHVMGFIQMLRQRGVLRKVKDSSSSAALFLGKGCRLRYSNASGLHRLAA